MSVLLAAAMSLAFPVPAFAQDAPKQSPDDGRVVSTFVVQALNGEDLTVFGTGEQTRSFCYVDDLVSSRRIWTAIRLRTGGASGDADKGSPARLFFLNNHPHRGGLMVHLGGRLQLHRRCEADAP